jgi:LysM domain.
MMKMKNRYLALCWSALCLVTAAPAVLAQDYTPVPVTISRSQISMNGRQYYAHIVLERQTIFGITKAYNVTEEDLYEANPMLKQEGLRSGTVIYVPVVSDRKEKVTAPAKETTEKEKPVTKEKTEAKEKTVVKETPAPKEKPAREKTVREKPVREKPVREKPAKETAPKTVEPKEGYVQHTVKWFENIYDVAAAYGVTPQQIMDANGLKSSAISKRQVLLIPVGEASKATGQATVPTVTTTLVPVEAEKPKATAAPGKTVAEPEPAVKPEKKADADEPGIMDYPVAKGTADIALVMPFNANGKYSESNMDFYSGVLMALRDLEKEGIKTTLNVFDLQAGTPSAHDLNKNEVILGPISTADLTTILDVTDGRVPVISPLDQRAAGLAETREGFVQAPSSTASQYAELAAWAAEDRAREDRIILVSEITSDGGTAAATGIRNALRATGASSKRPAGPSGRDDPFPPLSRPVWSRAA